MEMLKVINEYRKHPRFQVERHFDIYLIKYLCDIINYFYETTYDFIIPEFPIRKKLLIPKNKSVYESISTDYALFDRTNKMIACVELKTDLESNNAKQDANMKVIESLDSLELARFIEERCNYKKNQVSTMKFTHLRNYMIQNKVMDCRNGKVKIYKITPTNIKAAGDYLSFSKIYNEYKNKEDKNWMIIKEYLKEWDNPIVN